MRPSPADGKRNVTAAAAGMHSGNNERGKEKLRYLETTSYPATSSSCLSSVFHSNKTRICGSCFKAPAGHGPVQRGVSHQHLSVVVYSWEARRRSAEGRRMASIRAAAARFPRPSWSTAGVAVTRRMEGIGGAPRYFGDSIRSGRVLGEEERAAENVYIQKMEREKLEKLRRKADQEKAEAAKRAAAAKGDKKDEGPHPG